MKPGYKTSEFWLNLLVFLLGTLLASGIISDGGLAAKAIGGALALFSSLGYTLGRSGVKKAESAGQAYVEAANDNAAEELPATNPIAESV